MDKYPVLLESKVAGEMTIEQEALYTWFDLRCSELIDGIWCAWVIGEHGQLRIGILEPQGQAMTIRRCFSDRMTNPIGNILRCEIRPIGEAEKWEPLSAPEQVIQTLWLREKLRGQDGIRYRKTGSRLLLIFPYMPEKPFLLESLFCFAQLKKIEGKECWQIAFDERDHPSFF